MKSLCIKTNNDKIIDYLFNKFENINLVETYITIKEFKHYTNIILHYKDNSLLWFNVFRIGEISIHTHTVLPEPLHLLRFLQHHFAGAARQLCLCSRKRNANARARQRHQHHLSRRRNTFTTYDRATAHNPL